MSTAVKCCPDEQNEGPKITDTATSPPILLTVPVELPLGVTDGEGVLLLVEVGVAVVVAVCEAVCVPLKVGAAVGVPLGVPELVGVPVDEAVPVGDAVRVADGLPVAV